MSVEREPRKTRWPQPQEAQKGGRGASGAGGTEQLPLFPQPSPSNFSSSWQPNLLSLLSFIPFLLQNFLERNRDTKAR